MDRSHGMGRRPPGIAGLWRLIREEFAPLEADFARYYHLELAELVFGPNRRVPLRRIHNLINHLPADSAFVRSAASRLQAKPAPWTTTDYLLAMVAELTDGTNRLLEAAFGKKGSKPHRPLRIPRPGDLDAERPRPVSMSSEEARSFFGGAATVTPPADEDDPDEEPQQL